MEINRVCKPSTRGV